MKAARACTAAIGAALASASRSLRGTTSSGMSTAARAKSLSLGGGTGGAEMVVDAASEVCAAMAAAVAAAIIVEMFVTMPRGAGEEMAAI